MASLVVLLVAPPPPPSSSSSSSSSLSSKQPPLALPPLVSRVDKKKKKKNKFIKLQLVLCSNKNNHPNSSSSSSVSEENESSSSSSSWCGGGLARRRRRQMVLQLLTAASLLATPLPSFAFPAPNDLGPNFRTYSDESNKFNIIIPTDWEVGSGENNNGVTSLTAFYPAQPSASNVTVVITGLGADYTKLESFGKVDAFAENLVSGLDRSWQRPPGVAAKLIDSKAANGMYYIEYTLQKPGESRRHLYSVLGMANNGTYNRLYTVTGQFVDEDSEKYGSQIEKAVASFRLI